MIFTIAWKNVWRNKLRSLIVIFAVTLGLLAGSFGAAVMEGVSKQRTKAIIYNEISHVQVHHKKFADNNEAKYFIENPEKVISEIKQNKKVVAVTSRMLVMGMLSTANGKTGAVIYGINPEEEKNVTEIYKFVKDSTGNYFEKKHKNQVLISEALAKKIKLDRYKITDDVLKKFAEIGILPEDIEKLERIKNQEFRKLITYLQKLRQLLGKEEVEKHNFFLTRLALRIKPRARIVISFLNKDAENVGDNFKVVGIYKTKNTMFDEMSVFVRKSDLTRITGYDKSAIHEIAVILKDKKDAKKLASDINKNNPNLHAETWGEMNPELAMLVEFMSLYGYILVGIILAALAFGIVNTMLMAIMERTKELGMLKAVGMNRKRIFAMIMSETTFLTLIGAIVGLTANYFLISHLSKVGIDLSASMGEAFEAIGYDAVMYPEMGFDYYIGITIMVIITAILASIYPAIKAIKLNPAEAIRSDA